MPGITCPADAACTWTPAAPAEDAEPRSDEVGSDAASSCDALARSSTTQRLYLSRHFALCTRPFGPSWHAEQSLLRPCSWYQVQGGFPTTSSGKTLASLSPASLAGHPASPDPSPSPLTGLCWPSVPESQQPHQDRSQRRSGAAPTT